MRRRDVAPPIQDDYFRVVLIIAHTGLSPRRRPRSKPFRLKIGFEFLPILQRPISRAAPPPYGFCGVVGDAALYFERFEYCAEETSKFVLVSRERRRLSGEEIKIACGGVGDFTGKSTRVGTLARFGYALRIIGEAAASASRCR